MRRSSFKKTSKMTGGVGARARQPRLCANVWTVRRSAPERVFRVKKHQAEAKAEAKQLIS